MNLPQNSTATAVALYCGTSQGAMLGLLELQHQMAACDKVLDLLRMLSRLSEPHTVSRVNSRAPQSCLTEQTRCHVLPLLAVHLSSPLCLQDGIIHVIPAAALTEQAATCQCDAWHRAWCANSIVVQRHLVARPHGEVGARNLTRPMTSSVLQERMRHAASACVT